ncbi:remorin 1.4 [Rhodamnia argentea]|uniref:Remorin 1.4 n=1 Tax=Rhodamnia argentea TaxID=178133 RepID=A0A8B8MST3_9MYRT|nr:remorin 1.4 [Rhodamnia argentea]
MEQLLKQTRLKFSGVGREKAEGTSNIRDRKIPTQKTQSFKGDKRSQSWLQRQFTRQTSRSDGYSGGEDELAAAVAAATFAVNNLDEGFFTPNSSPMSAGPESTLTKAKSKRHNGSTQLETGEESLKSADRKIPITGPAQTVQRRSTFAEKLLESTEDAREGAPPPPKPSPSIKKASSSADKQFKKVNSMKPEISSPPMPELEPLPTITPVRPPPPPELKTSQSPAIPGGESKADAWIRQESSRIKERYDSLNATIVSWEIEKKKKARRKLDVTESEVERKRSKALQTFRAEMERIGQIAAGARAKAEERQRNEELKAREKANKIRTTGKPPTTCFCC